MLTKRFAATVLFLLLAFVAAATAATLDPLLRGLADREKGSGDDFALRYERIVATERDATGRLRVGVILRLEDGLPDLSRVPGLVVGSVSGRIATARLPLSSLEALVATDGIAHVEAALVSYPQMNVAVPAARVDQVWNGAPAYTGEGVIVGVIDTGIDWSHQDFDHADGTTRILSIWDLYGTGTPPAGFGYGAEWSAAQINAGTAAEHDLNGHGTHVSGMAAGNGRASGGLYRGVAYEADIVFAKAYDDQNGGFPNDKTIDAINYMAAKAQQYGRPMVLNMSLGGHGGPHDGTTAQEQVVDNLVAQGVVVCIAAGNEGEDFLHDSGPAANTDLVFRMLDYTPNPGNENDGALVAIWVDGATSPAVTVSLGGASLGPVASGSNGRENTTAGTIIVNNAPDGPDPSNGDKLIYVQLDDRDGTAPSPGDWIIHLSGGGGTAHAWKQYSTMVTGFPDSDQSYSVGTPGTAAGALTLAAVKTRQEWPSLAGWANYGVGNSWGDAAVGDRAPFSSIGPTRDGREKPDLAAPGMAIVSVRSGDITPAPADNLLVSGGDYYVAQGTSMASPFAAGVVALLLEKNGALTPAEVKSILRSTAVSDAFTGTTWNAHWGAGKLDAAAAIAAVGGGGANGDVDGDGTPNVIDVVLLANYIIDETGHPLSAEQRARADVYPAGGGDGLLNVSDLTRVVAFILETDQPGKRLPATSVTVTLESPRQVDDAWWMPVQLAGSGLAAGQFALDLQGAGWRDAAPRVEAAGSVSTAAHAVGSRLRVLFYDLDNALPDALTLLLPCDGPGAASPAGLLLVDGAGEPLAAEFRSAVFAGELDVFPNPVGAAAEIRFAAPPGRPFSLAVYDLRGRRVRVLERGESLAEAGVIEWQGEDDRGRRLAGGLYVVRLVSGDRVLTRKMSLMK